MNAIIFLSILSFAGDFVIVIISFNLISFYLGLKRFIFLAIRFDFDRSI